MSDMASINFSPLPSPSGASPPQAMLPNQTNDNVLDVEFVEHSASLAFLTPEPSESPLLDSSSEDPARPHSVSKQTISRHAGEDPALVKTVTFARLVSTRQVSSDERRPRLHTQVTNGSIDSPFIRPPTTSSPRRGRSTLVSASPKHSSPSLTAVGVPSSKPDGDDEKALRPSRSKSFKEAAIMAASMTLNIRHQVIIDPSRCPKLRTCCARILETMAFKVISFASLGFALFGSPMFVLFNVPDEPFGTILLDVLMILVAFCFIVELVSESIAIRRYIFSFFFWMDLAGLISMVFEVSFLLGPHSQVYQTSSQVDGVILRTARVAKVGARAARMSKLAKCLSLIRRRNSGADPPLSSEHDEYDARWLKARLSHTLSTKVSMLSLALVIGVPLFQVWDYPQADLSMSGWSRTMELDYARGYEILASNPSLNSTDFFERTVREMINFYGDYMYFPYDLQGYDEELVIDGRRVSLRGASLLRGARPVRDQFIWEQNSAAEDGSRRACQDNPGLGFCRTSAEAKISWDFTVPRQSGAATDVGMILFVIICMAMESFDLNRTLDDIVVTPVEKMCGTIRIMATVLSSVKINGNDEAEDDEPTETLSDQRLYERLLRKLRKLCVDFESMERQEMAEMAADNIEGRGFLEEVLMIQRPKEDMTIFSERNDHPSQNNHPFLTIAQNLPVEAAVIESWDLDLLSMDAIGQYQVMLYIFFDSMVGKSTGRIWCDVKTFERFHGAVKAGYMDTPYHNYVHACDVSATVFRSFNHMQCVEWLSDIDMYSLLISAMCHDIGHPGKTTPFLVESMHELALRYNDKSPLENMHCATLFHICSESSTNAFRKFDKDAFKQARKVCITSILHTDNALHFELVKEVKKVYESTKDVCDAQSKEPDILLEDYVEEVLYKETTLWHQLILHMSDVSTPLKPFHISKCWATRVQDEFFAQGDEEKRLGLPVGMLNDREKVSRTGAEHGFITFLVGPLTLAAVGNFPSLLHLASQMVQNLQEWRDLWVKDVKPCVEDIKKKDADILKYREQVDQMRQRMPQKNPQHERKSVKSKSLIHAMAASGLPLAVRERRISDA